MNFDQIEAFIYAAHTESFSRAGEILFISQPSVSMKIKTLEEEMDVTLFERNGKLIHLSEEGKLFLPYAQKVMKTIHEGVAEVQKSKHPLDAEITIAAVFSGVSLFLPNILKSFNERHPTLKPVIYAGHSEQVLKMVLDGEVSVGIVRSLLHSKIESFTLMKDDMILACHPDHPFGAMGEISIKEVADTPFILFKHETLDWTLIHNAFEKAHLSPNIILEVDSIEGAKQMVKENMGISILPRFSIETELRSGQLETASISGMPTINRNFDLIFTQGKDFNDATRMFVDFLKDRFGSV